LGKTSKDADRARRQAIVTARRHTGPAGSFAACRPINDTHASTPFSGCLARGRNRGCVEVQPLTIRSNNMPQVTMRQMLEAGVHFGHQTRYWNPKMAPYIFGARGKIHIINLEKTVPLFKDAMNYLSSLGQRRKTVLFVGTKRAARDVLAEEAKRCNMPYVTQRWLGGMLTNFRTVKQSVGRLKELQAAETDGTFDKLVKHEVLDLLRQRDKLEKSLGGIQGMEKLPDAMFVIDIGYEDIAVQDARKLGIPVVAVV